MKLSWIATATVALVLAAGCSRRPTSTAPNAEGPDGTGATPPGSTTRPATRPDVPQSSGRAVPDERPNGPVIIDGAGGGSPGTR